MDPSLVVLLNCLEEIKTKISDNEYKTMIEELQKINSNNNQNIKEYEIVITYQFINDDDSIDLEDRDYKVKISKKRQMIIRSSEFDNFCRSDRTSKIFNYEKELLEKLLYEYIMDEQDFKCITYFTIIKIN